MEKIWMVVSPHNPFKSKKSLANDYDRLHLLNLAIGDDLSIKASDVEFKLPKPSYTIDTMTHLDELYPQHEFSLIMGGDNLVSFHKWKNYELLLERYQIFVYKRPSYDLPELAQHEKVTIEEAPLLNISSSFIRKQIREGKSVKYLVPDKVHDYLLENPIYTRIQDQ